MAISTCVSCQEKLFCADSALSITGSVIGILTFVGAAMISIQIYLSSIRNANWDIHLVSRRLESRLAEVQHLQDLLKIENDTSGILREMLSPGVQRASAALEESEHLLHQIDSGSGDKRGRYLKSTRFVYAADDLKKYIEKTDDALGIIRGQVIGALLRVVFTSVERIEGYIRQTSAQMESLKSDNQQSIYLLEELQSTNREMRSDD